MATETESFVTAPSTPELAAAAAPMAPATVEPAAQSQPQPADRLEIVVERRLRQHEDGESSSMTIFRVPAHVRETSKQLYEPRLVSVGPYYRGREALRAMEQHKWRYLRELMARLPAPPAAASTPGDFVRAVRDVEQEARRCYSERTSIFDFDAGAASQGEPSSGSGGGEIEEEQSRRVVGDDPGPGPDAFAEMLMLDGCFILEFFTKWQFRQPDKLCDVAWGLLLHSDLLLLENQIPFFVLEALFRLVFPEATRLGLFSLILGHLKFSSYQLRTAAGVLVNSNIHHLLHLLYEAVMLRADDDETASIQNSPPPPPPPLPQISVMLKNAVSARFVFFGDMPPCMKTTLPATLLRKVSAWFSKILALIRSRRSTAPAPTLVVPSATQLREAGVRFEKKPSPRHLFDVAFDRDTGVLEMPPLVVDYATTAVLVNLVAFEQTSTRLPGEASKQLSSYAALVGALARTGKDVELLQKRGVVENLLDGDDDAATRFFRHLGDCSSLNYGDHVFAGMFTDLREFYHSSWRRHKAKFVRDHCSSPWALLALVVAISGFCFALFKLSTAILGLARPGYCHC